jgi:hypothetical protein
MIVIVNWAKEALINRILDEIAHIGTSQLVLLTKHNWQQWLIRKGSWVLGCSNDGV